MCCHKNGFIHFRFILCNFKQLLTQPVFLCLRMIFRVQKQKIIAINHFMIIARTRGWKPFFRIIFLHVAYQRVMVTHYHANVGFVCQAAVLQFFLQQINHNLMVCATVRLFRMGNVVVVDLVAHMNNCVRLWEDGLNHIKRFLYPRCILCFVTNVNIAHRHKLKNRFFCIFDDICKRNRIAFHAIGYRNGTNVCGFTHRDGTGIFHACLIRHFIVCGIINCCTWRCHR